MSSFDPCLSFLTRDAPWADPTLPTAAAGPEGARQRRACATGALLNALCGTADCDDNPPEGAARDAPHREVLLACILFYASYLVHWAESGRPVGGGSSGAAFDSYLQRTYGVTHHGAVAAQRSHRRGRRASTAAAAASGPSPQPLLGHPKSTAEETADGPCATAVGAALGRVLPRLPPAEQLWQMPALVSSLAALAADVGALERLHHGDAGSGGQEQGVAPAPPCPLCMSAALDDALLAETCWCLLRLHATTGGAGAGRKKAAGGPAAADRYTPIVHALAVCRTAIHNGGRDVPRRVAENWLGAFSPNAPPSPPSTLETAAGHEPLLLCPQRFGLAVMSAVVADVAALAAAEKSSSSTAPPLWAPGPTADDDDDDDDDDEEEEEEEVLRERQDARLADTLRALQRFFVHLPQAPRNGGGTVSTAAAAADGALLFARFAVTAPFPSLRASPHHHRGGATLLSWVCLNGYLQSARRILHPLLARPTEGEEGAGDHPWATAPLNDALDTVVSAAVARHRQKGHRSAAAADDDDEGVWVGLARLLLLAGASAASVSLPAEAASHVEGGRAAGHRLQRLLELLSRPATVLEDPPAAGGKAAPLLERIRRAATPPTAADALAQLSSRLWLEKVADMAPPTAAVLAAQDRVLRPALAALALDPSQLTARLTLCAVLGRKLRDSGGPKADALTDEERRGLAVYREAVRRLHEDMAAGNPLVLAVEARRRLLTMAIALERERIEEHRRQAGGGAAAVDDGDGDGEPRRSRAAAALEELDTLWETVRRDVAAAEARPAAAPLTGAGGKGGAMTAAIGDGPVEYVRVAVPAALLYADAAPGRAECLSVWVRVSPHVDVAATLQLSAGPDGDDSGDAGAAESTAQPPVACFGLIDTEMPMHLPLCRGDIVLFRQVRPTADDGSSGSCEATGVVTPKERGVRRWRHSRVTARCVRRRGREDGEAGELVLMHVCAASASALSLAMPGGREGGDVTARRAAHHPLHWLGVGRPTQTGQQQQQSPRAVAAGTAAPLVSSALLNANDAIATALADPVLAGAWRAAADIGSGSPTHPYGDQPWLLIDDHTNSSDVNSSSSSSSSVGSGGDYDSAVERGSPRTASGHLAQVLYARLPCLTGRVAFPPIERPAASGREGGDGAEWRRQGSHCCHSAIASYTILVDTAAAPDGGAVVLGLA